MYLHSIYCSLQLLVIGKRCDHAQCIIDALFLIKMNVSLTLLSSPLLLLSATRVTVLLLLRSCDLLCIGTEGGGVYFLELPHLSLKDSQTLLQDQVTQR